MEENADIVPKKQAIEYLKQGQVEEALAILVPLSEQDSDDAELHTLLGVAYNKKNDRLHTTFHFEEALRLEVSPQAYFNLGMAYEYASRVDEAVRQYQAALDLNPDYKNAKGALDRLKSEFESSGP